METMELFNYYSLDEVIDRKSVMSKLKSLKKEGKIEYQLEGEIVNIEDIDLDETETEELIELFDANDVFPYLEREDENDDDDYYGDDYDNNDDY
jgi:hypothetical protein